MSSPTLRVKRQQQGEPDDKSPLLDHSDSTNDPTTSEAHSIKTSYTSFIALGLIFFGFLFLLFTIYSSFPNLDENEKTQLFQLPRNMGDAKKLGQILKKYSQNHFMSVLIAYASSYIFLQTFAIPGSIFLSVLSGFLYPFPLAIALVCSCSALGAALCYLLSYLVARKIVLIFLSNKIRQWQQKIRQQKGNMLYYIIFLRITPIVPNWFINLTSPLIDIPPVAFVLGTFIGVAPPSCIFIQMGTTLNKLANDASIFSWQYFFMLALFSLVALLPVWFKNTIKKSIE